MSQLKHVRTKASHAHLGECDEGSGHSSYARVIGMAPLARQGGRETSSSTTKV
jgi:hypothetical protein